MDNNGRSRGRDGLDRMNSPDRWELLLASIMNASEPELLRRREQQNITALLVSWARPALSAAATVVFLVSAAVALMGRLPAEALAVPAIQSAIVPEEMAAWLVAGYEPTVTEVVLALEEVSR